MKAAYEALAANDPQRKAAAVEGLLQAPPPPMAVGIQPSLLMALGAREAAIEALKTDGGQPRLGPTPALFDPALKPLRDDPAYVRQLETTGLIDYWRKTKTRPDMCREPTPPAFCAKI